MVEIACVTDLAERNFRMAFAAVLPEPVLMHIPVAAGTVAVVQFTEYLELFSVAGNSLMAFGAINLPVLSFQREVALVVAEARGGTEMAESVAGGTLHSKGFLVEIGVAGYAFLFKPQECAGPVLQFFVRDELPLMALVAADLTVFPLQVVPGEAVVEAILIKPDHLEFPSVVIVVAGRTFISLYFGGGVIPPAGFDPGIDIRMAGEALPVGYFLP